MNKNRAIVWFRYDLRLHDHEPLVRALDAHEEVVPVFCIDPRWFESTELGFPKMGAHRVQFMLQSLTDLRAYFRQTLWSDLIIRIGDPAEQLSALLDATDAEGIYFYQYPGTEEKADTDSILAICKQKQIQAHVYQGDTLYHMDDLPFDLTELPDIFTAFRKQMEKSVEVRKPLPTPERMGPLPEIVSGSIPSLQDLGYNEPERDTRAALHIQGGETKALDRLEHYFWATDELKNYKYKRNGLLGADYSSKFAPWLAWGCISPRKIYDEVQHYERERVKNQSTYWLVFELLWRDFFHLVCYKYGSKIFRAGGFRGDNGIEWKHDRELFSKWCNGETGIPFIDANMIELKNTGFMSNRGRQNVASFLVKDLGIDWRWGAAWFEHRLIDHDVASNYGNWNYVAGIGNDPRSDRYFNILTQADRYDTKGDFVRHWIPGLKELPKRLIHRPYLMRPEEQVLQGVTLGTQYPKPILDTTQWRSEQYFSK